MKANEVYYIVPWIMPDEYHYGSARVDNKKALSSGLTLWDLKMTITDLLAWWNAQDDERRSKVEQNPKSIIAREKEILEKWKSRNSG